MDRDFHSGDGGFRRSMGRSTYLALEKQLRGLCEYTKIQKINTEFRPGAITDYGPSMVQWMRNRQPRYKGGAYLEMERPSPSYVIDVCCRSHSCCSKDMADKLQFSDAPTGCRSPARGRHNTLKTSALFPEQNQTPGECGQMDARRAAAVDWLQ